MEKEEVEKLLEKFYEGKTSQKEEYKLGFYFLNNKEIPNDWEKDKNLLIGLLYMSEKKNLDLLHKKIESIYEQNKNEVSKKRTKSGIDILTYLKENRWKVSGVAASLVLLIGFGFIIKNNIHLSSRMNLIAKSTIINDSRSNIIKNLEADTLALPDVKSMHTPETETSYIKNEEEDKNNTEKNKDYLAFSGTENDNEIIILNNYNINTTDIFGWIEETIIPTHINIE